MRDLPEQLTYKSGLFLRVLDENNPDLSQRDRKIDIDLVGCGALTSFTNSGNSVVNLAPTSSIRNASVGAIIQVRNATDSINLRIQATAQNNNTRPGYWYIKLNPGGDPSQIAFVNVGSAVNAGAVIDRNTVINSPGEGLYLVFVAPSPGRFQNVTIALTTQA